MAIRAGRRCCRTPNHPEYPSAHSCLTPAAGPSSPGSCASEDRLHDPEPGRPPYRPTFERPAALEYDVANARIWGGIHFRSAVEEGAKIEEDR